MENGVKVENLEEVQQMLAELAERLEDLRPALLEAAQVIQNSTEEAFESGVSPWGKTWTPLASSTLDAKGASALNPLSTGKMLYESGRLRESLYISVGMDARSVEVGVNAHAKGYPYPAVHQFGTRDAKVPARPFLPMDSSGELERGVSEEILEAFQEYLK